MGCAIRFLNWHLGFSGSFGRDSRFELRRSLLRFKRRFVQSRRRGCGCNPRFPRIHNNDKRRLSRLNTSNLWRHDCGGHGFWRGRGPFQRRRRDLRGLCKAIFFLRRQRSHYQLSQQAQVADVAVVESERLRRKCLQ